MALAICVYVFLIDHDYYSFSVTIFILSQHLPWGKTFSSRVPSVCPSTQVGMYWVGHILDTLHRVCVITSITMIKKEGSCWVFFQLLDTFTFFVNGNLTLSIQ